MDVQPHQPTPADVSMLQSLAEWAQSELQVSKFSPGQQVVIQRLTASERKTLMNAGTALWNAEGLRHVLQDEERPMAIRVAVTDTSEPVVKQVSEWIRFSVRASDALAYLGQGVFGVVLAEGDISTVQADVRVLAGNDVDSLFDRLPAI